ncbi:uncharacterized protein PEZ65_001469 [Lycodopsis pacificus]
MAGRLLFVILMYSFHKIQTQGIYQPQPKLIVNSPVITETETVALDCQTPSSVPVKHCYFYTVGRGQHKGFSCLQTLTGTELLRMSEQRSPAEVQVKCYYTVMLGEKIYPSPHSDTSSITIQIQKPQLSLHHIVGEQVLFTCSLPGSANTDTRCNLYFGEESHLVATRTVWKKRSSKHLWFCQFTVTIDDLLRRLHVLQRSDASCDYSLGSKPNSLSPRSDRYSLNDIVKKESSMTSTDSAFTQNKDLTDSRSTASTFGITGKPVSDVVESSTTQTKPPSMTTAGVTVRLLASTPVTPIKQTSGKKLTDIVKKESSMTSTDSAFTQNKGETETETWIWKYWYMILAACLGGVFLLGLALLFTKRRFGKRSNKRSQANVTDDLMSMRNLEHRGSLPADDEGAYSMITSVAAADCPTASEKLKEQAPQNEDVSEICTVLNIYATIAEHPPASALEGMVYSTLQPH